MAVANDETPETSAAGRRGGILFRIGLAGVLVVAAALRFWQIGRLEMWLDECHTVVLAASPGGVWSGLKGDSNAPLYYVLMRGWIALTGVEAEAVRLFSALCGVAGLAALAGWMRQLTGSRRAALWAAAAGAVTPIHIYYSQEARGYALVWLLCTLAAWTLTAAAARTRDGAAGRRGAVLWGLHSVFLAAGIFAHDLVLSLIPACWLAAWALGADRRVWGRLAASHGLALLLASPYLAHSFSQPKDQGTTWIGPLWEATPPALAIPKSLEAFLIGGRLPPYLRTAPPGEGLRLLAVGWGAAVVIVAAAAAWRAGRRREGRGESARAAFLVLTAFLLTPLVLPYLYSILKRPIYVVGRYDTLALPAFLGLLGLGTALLQRLLLRRSVLLGHAVPAVVLVALAAGALAPRYRKSTLSVEVTRIQERRAAVLARNARPGDGFVCMGQEGLKIAYQMMRLERPWKCATFPSDTAEHPGWFEPQEAAARGAQALAADADAVLRTAGGGAGRLWIVMDPYSGRQGSGAGAPEPHGVISTSFLNRAEKSGWRDVTARDPALAGTGLLLYAGPQSR